MSFLRLVARESCDDGWAIGLFWLTDPCSGDGEGFLEKEVSFTCHGKELFFSVNNGSEERSGTSLPGLELRCSFNFSEPGVLVRWLGEVTCEEEREGGVLANIPSSTSYS